MGVFHPTSGHGILQGEIDRLKTDINRKADSHEISSLNSRMGSVEREVSQISTEIDGLRSELQRLEESINQEHN